MQLLVVVDMQPFFLRGYTRKAIKPTQKLVSIFSGLHWPILFLEMAYFGRTINRIRDICPRTPWVRKHDQDGSSSVLRRIEKEKWPLDLAICGVYLDQCVRKTANSLSFVSNVCVVKDASKPYSPQYSPSHDWENKVKFASMQTYMRDMLSIKQHILS
jgi:nicotinamidase-related amidase